MGDAGGYLRFPAGSLDPQAQEFRPRHLISSSPPHHHLLAVLPPPLHNHFFYQPPPPPPHTDGALLGYPHLPLQPFHHIITSNNIYNHDYTHPPYYLTSSTTPVPHPPPPPSLSPTRAILLSSLPADVGVSETLIRRELEVFGEVRGVQMERIRDGIATVHFYDIRHAEAALNAIRDHHRGGGALLTAAARGPCAIWRGGVWAQYTIPCINAVTEGHNQGTVVVFNLDPNASTSHLLQFFQPYGAVKEVRETPLKKQQRFVEFYDARDAARALREMNGKEILGKPVVIEFSRPGGFTKKFFDSTATTNHTPKYIPFKRYSNNRNIPPPPARITVRKNHPSEEVGGMEGLSLKGSGKKLSQQSHGSGGRAWKGGKHQFMKGNSNRHDIRFLMNEEAMVLSSSSGGDCRTTVMIKNIPNKYSQKLLLNMLDNHCIHSNEQIANQGEEEHNQQQQQPFSSYDFVYLPIDFNNKCNVGYGFVNMTSPQGAWRLYKAFHHQHWEVFHSKKICEVTYARIQGLEALKEHFKKSKFPSEAEHYLPVVFSPPRDGKQLTEPHPIMNGGGGGGGGGGGNHGEKQQNEECSGGGGWDGNGDSDRDCSRSCNSSSLLDNNNDNLIDNVVEV